MATLVLGAAGAATGGSIGGAILGVSAATIGGLIGSTIGSVVDSWIVSSLAPTQRIEGARLDTLRITSSTEGAVIPRLYGRMRMGGNIIWATDFREETKTTTQGGGKGGGPKVKTTEYLYYASFAVALCEGPITGIGRIWADGKLMDTAGITWRWYPGDEAQTADPFISAKMGAAGTPAYRGTAYVVFEELPLGDYGNRLPQLSFEVFAPLADTDTAEGLIRAVTMIPASGEFVYATDGIRKGLAGNQGSENLNALSDTADMVVALDRLQAMAPKVESVSLVTAWFGDDLRAGDCTIRPKVDAALKTTSTPWVVDGVARDQALETSRISAPDDFTYVAQDIAAGNPSFNPAGNLFDPVPGWTRVSGSGSIRQGTGAFDPEPTIFATDPGVFELEAAVDFAAGQPITLSFDYAAYVNDLNDVVTVELVALSSAGVELANDSVTLSSPDTDIRPASITLTPSSDVGKVKVRTSATEVAAPNWIYVNIDMAHFSLTGYRKVFAPGTIPAFGGTPADVAVVQAIQEIKARGLRVTFYPFILMDVPPGNTLPDPYSDNAAATGQPAFPWRGRITSSPAAGYAGSIDKTATAADQVAAFFGSASPSDFAVSVGPLAQSYPGVSATAGSPEDGYATITWPGTVQSGGAPAAQPGQTWQIDHGAESSTVEVKAVVNDPRNGTTVWQVSPRTVAWAAQTVSARELRAPDPSDVHVTWTGAAGDWGLRRMVLHYAHLCAAAGGVDAFLIGSEMRGLTTTRSGVSTYPAVQTFRDLAADVRSILGPSTKISYAADWSEYFGHHPQDDEAGSATGSSDPPNGDVFFHLDPLWGDPEIDFVGIDNYMPLSDWRDGFEHADAQQGWAAIHDRAYLQANIAGGEGFEWFYASDADRAAQVRTPITDGAQVFPLLTPARSFNETSGATISDADFGGSATRTADAAFSARVPLPASPSDGVLFERGGSGTGMLLCVRDAGTVFRYRVGLGSVTAPGPEAAFLDVPVASMPFDGAEHELVWDVTLATGMIRLWCDGLLLGTAYATDGKLGAWSGSGSGSYGASGSGATNITGEPTTGWAVPCPNPLLMYDQAISLENVNSPWVFRTKDLVNWWSNAHHDRPGGHALMQPTAWVPQSKPIRFTELGCPAIDRGTNQPNVFFDPKSSESALPHFSRGWRDDAIQRAYLEATYLFWGDAANNPLSSVYGDRMVDVSQCAAWTWDARPYPFFPALTDVWTDGGNWRLGHWLTGRLGAVSLAALVRHLCLRAGLPETRIDVTGLWGAVEGYTITALESPRASITTLSRHFGFDAVETEGVIRFVMRGRAAAATVSPDDLVAPRAGSNAREGDVLELTRGQETELPEALKWQVARADEDYNAAQVEARRITVDSTRIASESFPMAVPPEEAERRCRRALMEAWTGRESATFRLPPSRLALDPADVVTLDHDGRLVDLRLISIADADARGVEAVRQDRAAYDLPPGQARPSALSKAVVFGAPEAVLLDLPQLTEDQPAHRPFVAAHAVPWPGEMAVYRSPSTDGFELLTSFGTRARIGTLVSDFYAGPTSRLDLGNALVVDLLTGTLESVTDLTLLSGANALAIETAPGTWEIVQAGAAELIAPGRYRLTRLLRGQRGTEAAMSNPAPAGAPVVVLDDSLASLPISEADLGIPWNWRIGPASRPVSDETFVAQAFTPEGVGLRPFSVVHVEQPWRKPRTPGDLTIRWTRRSRALAADSWSGLEVPLGEELEAYEVEILDGATVKRVLSTATTSAVYTAAQQTADWGATLGPGDTLDIRITQLSALVGRGAPKTVTLQL